MKPRKLKLNEKFRVSFDVDVHEIETIQGFVEKRLYSTPTFKITRLKWKRKREVLNLPKNAKTKVVIYDEKSREIPTGTLLTVYEDKNCDWGYLVLFPKRKTLTGFYNREWFELIEEEKQ